MTTYRVDVNALIGWTVQANSPEQAIQIAEANIDDLELCTPGFDADLGIWPDHETWAAWRESKDDRL